MNPRPSPGQRLRWLGAALTLAACRGEGSTPRVEPAENHDSPQTAEPVGIELRDPIAGNWRVALLVTPPVPRARVAEQMASILSMGLRGCTARGADASATDDAGSGIASFSIEAVDGRLAFDIARASRQEFSLCVARALNGTVVTVLRGASRRIEVQLMAVRPAAEGAAR